MAAQIIDIDQFVGLSNQHLIVDVRSPAEYSHAHFPGAYSLPLFSDEERKVVGTTYKQQSREKAIKAGLDFFGPKMRGMVEAVETELKHKAEKTVLVHCWRGGMRSQAVAWLLDLYGFKVFVLQGGYKRFRNWVLDKFEENQPLRILSGKTGSGKTDILNKLKERGESVVDLEHLAGHKGSAFGGLGLPPQPSNEMFENKLAVELYAQNKLHPGKPVWLESESSRIGNLNIPIQFFTRMKQAERVNIEVTFEYRLQKTVQDYGNFTKNELIDSVNRIQRRLGGLDAKNTINFIEEGNIPEAFKILLGYYDRGYSSSSLFMPPFLNIELPGTDSNENAQIILEKLKNYNDTRIHTTH